MKKLLALVLFCALAACTSLPIPTSNTFSGYYTNSFETSAFVTCEMLTSNTSGVSYWLSADASTGFFDKLGQLMPTPVPDATVTPYTLRRAFVKFEGTLSPEGQYGHLGQYTREITVTKLVEMKSPAENQCT